MQNNFPSLLFVTKGFKSYYLTLSFVIATVVIFLIPNSVDLFAFNRFLILERHQWWRVITSIFTHSSVDHLTWNLITLFSSSLICESLNRKVFSVYLVLVIIVITVFKLNTHHNYLYSQGFSNVAAGSFCLLLLLLSQLGVKQKKNHLVVLSVCILLAFVLHELGLFGSSTAWELLSGRSINETPGQVVKPGHLVGMATGLLVGVIAFFYHSKIQDHRQ